MPKDVGVKKPKGILKKQGAKKLQRDAKPQKEARGGAGAATPPGAKHSLEKLVKKQGKGSVVKGNGTPSKSSDGQEQAKKKKAVPGPKSEHQRSRDAERAWKVGQDAAKGRIMTATRDLQPGEIILEEKPLVAASWHAHRCLECHEPHDSASCALVQEAYPAEVVSKLAKIEKFLTGLDAIGELDIARRLIKLLNMCRTDDQVETHTRPCTAENMPACLEAIKAIREHKLARAVLPAGMADEVAARLLSVLNTNSHELGEWGGSGFFLLACLMEHSCRPNCAFNTSGTDLWVTVVQPVPAGAPLSIDYTDSVFEPAAARVAHLEASYGFCCTCALCTREADLARAFLCPACQSKLCPRGQGLKPSQWRCDACARQLKQKERERFLRLEAALEQEPPDSLEEVDEVLEHGVFHSTHFVVLQPLRALGEAAAKDARALEDGTAEHVWRRVVEGAEEVLPAWHSHKAILWDNLAQVLVAAGKGEAAKEAFRRSYLITRVSAGDGTPPTELALALYKHPPTSTAELALSYASVKEQLASMERFGLQGLAFLANNTPDH